MKVYVVDPSNFTPYYDYALCRALRAAGVEATLATCRFKYEALPFADDLCHEYRFFKLSGWLGLAAARRAAKSVEYPIGLLRFALRLGRYRPDAVHFQWLMLPALELPLGQWLRGRGCRLIHTIHNLQSHDGAPIDSAYYRGLARCFDALIVHSERDKSDLDAMLAGEGCVVYVVPHGVLFAEQTRPHRRAARQLLSLPQEAPLILFFGLLERYKGAHILAAALPAVRARFPAAKLVIAGNRGTGSAALLDTLRRPDIGAHTFLRPSFVPSAEVAAYFAAADVVALPYLAASQSGVLMTACRFGAPVVVTDTGALGETVSRGPMGLVVPPGDAGALGEAIANLLASPSLRETMSRNARHLAVTRYEWSNIAAQTMAIYEAISTASRVRS